MFIIHHIFTCIAAYACTFLLHSVLELSFLVSSIIKNFRRFLKCILVCLKQLIQEYNLCQQLYTTLCLAENRCQYHIISSLSLSVFIFHIILKCNQLPKLLSSISYTPPYSTSGWRDGELKFLYDMGISQSVSAKSCL